MNTFLLIVNLIMNIFIIINILDIKRNNGTKNKKNTVKSFIDKMNNKIDDDEFDDFLDDDLNDKVKVIEGNVSPRLQKLRNQWDEEDTKEKFTQINKHNTFKDVDEFITYLSKYNLKIIDTLHGKTRTVKFLDNYTYNNQATVMITFDDNTKAIFRPNVYAKLSYGF